MRLRVLTLVVNLNKCFVMWSFNSLFFLFSIFISILKNISSIHMVIDIAAAAESLQSCPTLCDPIDGSPPGSTVPGILQARTLEWVAISFSNAWKWNVKVKSLSHVRLLATPWTAAYQAPLSMGFSRQEYWSGVPLPSPLAVHKLGRKSRNVNILETRGYFIYNMYVEACVCKRLMHCCLRMESTLKPIFLLSILTTIISFFS